MRWRSATLSGKREQVARGVAEHVDDDCLQQRAPDEAENDGQAREPRCLAGDRDDAQHGHGHDQQPQRHPCPAQPRRRAPQQQLARPADHLAEPRVADHVRPVQLEYVGPRELALEVGLQRHLAQLERLRVPVGLDPRVIAGRPSQRATRDEVAQRDARMLLADAMDHDHGLADVATAAPDRAHELLDQLEPARPVAPRLGSAGRIGDRQCAAIPVRRDRDHGPALQLDQVRPLGGLDHVGAPHARLVTERAAAAAVQLDVGARAEPQRLRLRPPQQVPRVGRAELQRQAPRPRGLGHGATLQTPPGACSVSAGATRSRSPSFDAALSGDGQGLRSWR